MKQIQTKNPLETFVEILVTNLLSKRDFKHINIITKFRCEELLRWGCRKFLDMSTLVRYNFSPKTVEMLH